MTFYTFMMRNYLNATGPRSDLAGDMKLDKETFPRNGNGKYAEWHRAIREYLEGCGACYACLDIFEECWRDYELRERKRKGMSLNNLSTGYEDEDEDEDCSLEDDEI